MRHTKAWLGNEEAVNLGGQKTQHRLSGKYSLGGVGISVAGSLKCQPFKSARVSGR
jgi:hypothetical protein